MIDFIKWSDDYCVGHTLLDIHHKLFFEMIKEFSQKIESGKQDIDAAEIVQFLHDYIDMHFSTEEKILREIHFPDLKNHHAIHSEFSKSINRLNAELYKSEVSYIIDKILDLTQTWFLDHILTQDKQFTRYLH